MGTKIGPGGARAVAGIVVRVAGDHDVDVRHGSVLSVVAACEHPDLLLVRYWTDGDYPDGDSDRCHWTRAEWATQTAGGEYIEASTEIAEMPRLGSLRLLLLLRRDPHNLLLWAAYYTHVGHLLPHSKMG